MNRSPECRAAFIEVVKTGENHPSRIVADRVDTPLNLSWEHDRRYDARDDVIKTWRWINHDTARVYEGFCLNYKPPTDVDPETILGKLGIMAAGPTGDVLPQPMTPEDCISIQAIIDTIESLQQRADDANTAIDPDVLMAKLKALGCGELTVSIGRSETTMEAEEIIRVIDVCHRTALLASDEWRKAEQRVKELEGQKDYLDESVSTFIRRDETQCNEIRELRQQAKEQP